MKNMFSPKTCKYDINSTNDVFKSLDDVCDKEKTFTDQELSDELGEITNFCCGGKTGRDFYFISHRRSDKLVKRRAEKYCKKHKIKLEDYNGVLPYRQFIIDMAPALKRKEKLTKITDNIKGCKHSYKETLDDKWWNFHKKIKKNKNGKARTR